MYNCGKPNNNDDVTANGDFVYLHTIDILVVFVIIHVLM